MLQGRAQSAETQNEKSRDIHIAKLGTAQAVSQCDLIARIQHEANMKALQQLQARSERGHHQCAMTVGTRFLNWGTERAH